MSKRERSGVRGLRCRGRIWHIQKSIPVGRGRSIQLCESTGTAILREAERYLARRTEEVREEHIYGVVPAMTLTAAATKYLEENQHLKSIKRAATALGSIVPELGHLTLEQISDASIGPYVQKRLRSVKPGTVARDLAVLRRILTLASRSWRSGSGQPYLRTVPLLTMPTGSARMPYPIDHVQERALLAELPEHLRDACKFILNTGVRAGELVKLRWDWEKPVAQSERSVFVLPAAYNKNGRSRVIVLNSAAQTVLERNRDRHPEVVFTFNGRPLQRLSNTSWKKARVRAGLSQVRIHDLRHTYAARLREAGVTHEDRQDLLGHTNGSVTTHYSAVDLNRLIAEAEKAGNVRPLLLKRQADWAGQKPGKAEHFAGANT